MDRNDITIRRSAPEGAPDLARLIDIAGEGLPTYLWAKMAEPGQDVWQVGEQRARREEGSFSYRNGWLAETGGTVAGSMIGYGLPDEPVEIGPEFPPMFVPLQELENLACNSWYINVLAVYPQLQGRGIGSLLIEKAEAVAADTGYGQMSIIVFDANLGARRLYERHGYREAAVKPIVKEGWKTRNSQSVLLLKSL